jgi:murein DD-endopeptidase MepM/ murein hydrolase activator NlpD
MVKPIVKVCVYLYFFLNASTSIAQIFSAKKYPQTFFDWPVDASIGIVANFGELRPNHYHMGLDCRTDQRVNIPVLAAGDGYIAKVKIEPFGFGRCIYINHPNGFTTVYAHLNNFETALETYITKKQYELKSWNIFIDIPANLFKVRKGDFIAFSGNTGGSQGPHVHFEVRETSTDKCLNPLMFGLPIADNVPPEIIRLAMYDKNKSTYEQSPKIFSLKKINGKYAVAGGQIIASSNKVSFALTMQDKVTGSPNPNGVYAAAVLDNDALVSKFELDSISYLDTRYLNAQIDYKVKANGGPYLQHITPLPGYKNKIYTTPINNGIIELNDSTIHPIKIIVADAAGNESVLEFNLAPSKNMYSNLENKTGAQKMIPEFINVFESNNLKFYLPEKAIYDTVFFTFKEQVDVNGNLIFQLHNPNIPVQTYFPVSIKANFAEADTGKIMMERAAGSKRDYAKANYKNGWYTAAFRAFGTVKLILDKTPPSITPIGFKDGANMQKASRIMFRVKDNTEEIEKFEALLDGKWLRFSNDKGVNFIYNFDENCGSGYHELQVTVTDLVGNKNIQTYNFTR